MSESALLEKSLFRRRADITTLRRIQIYLYDFLERPRGWPSIFYHIFVLLLAAGCLILSVLSTIPEYQETTQVLLIMEIIVVIWLALEYLIRIASCGCRSRYQGIKGRIRYLMTPYCILDMVVVIASAVVIGMGTTSPMFAAPALRGLRFFQILRMVRIDRRGGSWKLLGSVVYLHRQELLTTMYIGFLGLIFSSFLVYLFEKNENEQFSTFADALWWGVITLCTVGYGDRVPRTWQGKIVASFCALLGISFFALPAGILGSGFALKVQQHQRQKHIIRRRVPAATLIQCFWKIRALERNPPYESANRIKVRKSVSRIKFDRERSTARLSPVSLWTPFFRSPVSADTVQSNNFSYFGMETLRKKTSRLGLAEVSGYLFSPGMMRSRSSRMPNERRPSVSADWTAEDDALTSDYETVELQCLDAKYREAIRAIRRMKYMVARRKFREALKPYDVKDVIEQYSAGHAEMLVRVKALQSRIDQLATRSSLLSPSDTFLNQHALANRVVNIEQKLIALDLKITTFLEGQMQDSVSRMSDHSWQRPTNQQDGDCGSPGPNASSPGSSACREDDRGSLTKSEANSNVYPGEERQQENLLVVPQCDPKVKQESCPGSASESSTVDLA
uniref:Potassium voltage-gated channel subfamily KQT member 5 n=1 Tax=Trichuris muris TaxID=70415 RepID=A0A5S6QUH2_TRIMR